MEQPLGSSSDWRTLLAEQAARNGKLYYRLAYRILRDPGAAQDAFHDAIANALLRPPQLRDPKSIQAWLATLVWRECCLVLRRRKREQRALETYAKKSTTYEKSETSDDLRLAVFEAVDELPEMQRAVIALRLLEGLLGNAVSELLGSSAPSVSKHYQGGMEALRKVLKEWNPAEQ